MCGHDEEEHTEEAGCGIGDCLCCAYRRPTKKRKEIKKLIARLNDLLDQRKEIIREIDELNAKLRQETFDEWYEGKGIDGGILDVAHDAMITFWNGAADVVRFDASNCDRDIKPNFDPSPEKIFLQCLFYLDAYLETRTSKFTYLTRSQSRRLFKEGFLEGLSFREIFNGYKNVSAPVLRIVDAIQNLSRVRSQDTRAVDAVHHGSDDPDLD
jgi:hypothetical protein